MRLGPKIITSIALLLAALLSWLSAGVAAGIIENRSAAAVKTALIEANHEWARVNTDGLQIHIGGTAPNEAARFNALSVSGQVVEASRVIDGTTVTPAKAIQPPRFSVEILRNDDGIQLIGLVPDALDRDAMLAQIAAETSGVVITDFLESAAYPVPAGWVPALNYALEAVATLPRSKISIAAGEVSITAISGSVQEQRRIETALARAAPDDLRLKLSISAPRPVISPFTLRVVKTENGTAFDACSADTAEARERILSAAYAAGKEGRGTCTIGLGVPSPEWADAVVMAIEALDRLGNGSVTFSDADIALVTRHDTDRALFDDVVGGLESNLPEVFSLTAILPPPPEEPSAEAPPPEFTATRSPEGQVQIRGRLPSDTVRSMVESFARARFGIDAVYMSSRADPEGLPEDWPVRALAALTALSEVDHGSVTVLTDSLTLRGVSGNQNARDEITRAITEKLGESANIALDVSYDEKLDPLAALPTPQECIRKVEVILSTQKITFAPGSTAVEGESAAVVDQIADVLRTCRDVEMDVEIAGHTDSQGREQMNLELSEARAAAVLEALGERRVPISRISSKGYGETVPIADNDSAEGREANRRIEFRLVAQAPTEEAITMTDPPEEPATEDASAEDEEPPSE